MKIDIKNQLLGCLDSNDKAKIIDKLKQVMENYGYKIEGENINKPWGAYIKIRENKVKDFIDDFFKGNCNIIKGAELSPKLLLVKSSQRLSWQYHNRRREHWSFITDGYHYRSENDQMGDKIFVKSGECVSLKNQERHRLAGLDNEWCLVAEIWEHINKDNLSDEDDIIRLQDDYSR